MVRVIIVVAVCSGNVEFVNTFFNTFCTCISIVGSFLVSGAVESAFIEAVCPFVAIRASRNMVGIFPFNDFIDIIRAAEM